MYKSLILILISVLFSVTGQISLKAGMNGVNKFISENVANQNLQGTEKIIVILTNAFLNPKVIMGIGCYGFGMIFWLMVLSRVNLSFAYPILGISYILVVLSSVLILHEDVSLTRWVGTIVISLGVVLVAKG